MDHSYWSNLYSSWGWFLWFCIWLFLFLGLGTWGYSYRAHLKYNQRSFKSALEILDKRYARGEIKSEEYEIMKADISNGGEHNQGQDNW